MTLFFFLFVFFFFFFAFVSPPWVLLPRADNCRCLKKGLCAGKHEVVNYLVQEHNFKVLRLECPVREPSSNLPAPIHEVLSIDKHERVAKTFTSARDLISYVTKRWRDRFVTTDVQNERVLEVLLRRPFFILVSVDAPISVRWKRYKDR